MQEGQAPAEEVAPEKPRLKKRVMVVFHRTLSGGIVSANSTDNTKQLEVLNDGNGFLKEVRLKDKRTGRRYVVPLSNIAEVCEG